ncbi:UNVERIFIED_CONTAM: hypothetical protein Sradi_4369200 [Sesamum radiatum]|uniref:Transposon TX1 n=1 Tax=Sesamum radiatum TaxID=300843 RepID=A0AAW2NNP7_SESRA
MIMGGRGGCFDLKSNFGHVHRKVKELVDQLAGLDKDPIHTEDSLARSWLRHELDEFLSRKKIIWKQRGKAHWLSEGDRNTPFFHAEVSARQRKNSISRLRNKEGEWCLSKEGIQQIISAYFQDYFGLPILQRMRLLRFLMG